jgi:hypothetical protein
MAIDTRQKRMSALHVGCVWRGVLVDATEPGFGQGNRQAAIYVYSGILASPSQINTRQKRMSAMNLACVWRGPMVDATEPGFTAGNRAAADYMYSGEFVTPPPAGGQPPWSGFITNMGRMMTRKG